MRRPVRPEPRQANRPVGPLGWTAEERQKYKRTKKRPARAVEVPDGPTVLQRSWTLAERAFGQQARI
jgi:hypothetical protein